MLRVIEQVLNYSFSIRRYNYNANCVHRSINSMFNDAAILKVRASRKDTHILWDVNLRCKSIDRASFYCTWIYPRGQREIINIPCEHNG